MGNTAADILIDALHGWGVDVVFGLPLPIKVIVVKNNTLGMIKWEQMVFFGNPEYGCELHARAQELKIEN